MERNTAETMNEAIKDWFHENEISLIEYSKDIWDHPEPLMEEYHSCEATANFLKAQGFSVYTCHCRFPERKPNTVIASWGSGHPVVAIYGEYDALPGLAQPATSYRVESAGWGHGCGHNLMAAAAVGAACAVKAALEKSRFSGTVKMLACPAEEGGNGKMYMHKLGLFDGIDCLLGWHPEVGDLTGNEKISLSIEKLQFHFSGKASHAAAAPELGRSAMDAAELMSVGVQYLREHMSMDCRIHHKYLETMRGANIVPEHASVQYIVRAKDMNGMSELAKRVIKIAEGAALMTETQMQYQVESALPGTLILTSFTKFLYESAKKIPALEYTSEEEEFAAALYKNVFEQKCEGSALNKALEEPNGIPTLNYGSNDLGYTTYVIPTARYVGLGLIKDISVHHWALTATAGMSIGQKAAVYVSKALAQSMYDIFRNPNIIETWRQELEERKKGQVCEPIWPK